MKNNIIYVNFSKNKRRNKKISFSQILKNWFMDFFNLADNPLKNDENGKIIRYGRDIS